MTEKDKMLDFIKFLESEFTDKEVLDVAMYLIINQSISEATMKGLLSGNERISIPAMYMDYFYKYENALAMNQFYMRNVLVIKNYAVLSRIKGDGANRMSVELAKNKEGSIVADNIKSLVFAQMDMMVVLAFLWKGYDYAVEFLVKLRKALPLNEEVINIIDKLSKS